MKLLEAATASHVVASTYRGRWNLTDNAMTHTFDVYSSPIEIDNQNGQILTLVDVTEAAKAEAAFRRTEALAAVGEAAAQLAHEIKNPWAVFVWASKCCANTQLLMRRIDDHAGGAWHSAPEQTRS